MPLILDSPSASPIITTSSTPSFQRRSLHHTADVLIVGAGILGCALAITFARQGRSVLLLEKSLKEPDRIVGELLQPGGVSALEQLGLRDCLEEIDAVVVKGYEVIYYGEGVHIPYPYPKNASGVKSNGLEKGLARSRPEGRSFHHGRFIRRLREAAMREPNISVVETTVTAPVKTTLSGQILGVECQTQGCQDVYFADLTVVADGYASRFRKDFIPYAPTCRSKFWGLELIDADLPRFQHGHVVLGDGAPVLLYQIGSRETRALVDVPNDLESASPARGGIKAHLRDVVLPSLPACVQPSFAKALDEGRLRSMPNSFLPPSAQQFPGMIFLGDAMNMRHPLTGGGMTVAFNDVVLLRDLLSPEKVPDLSNTVRVKEQMQAFHWRRKNLSAVINILAMALYDLFAANGKNLLLLPLYPFPSSHPSCSSPFPLLTPSTYPPGALKSSFNLTLTMHFPRPAPPRPPTRLFPLLPTRRRLHRRSCRTPRRHHPATAHPLLSFLLRRPARHLVAARGGPAVEVTARDGEKRAGVLEGVYGFVSVYLE
jgi:squalene monooxygenase